MSMCWYRRRATLWCLRSMTCDVFCSGRTTHVSGAPFTQQAWAAPSQRLSSLTVCRFTRTVLHIIECSTLAYTRRARTHTDKRPQAIKIKKAHHSPGKDRTLNCSTSNHAAYTKWNAALQNHSGAQLINWHHCSNFTFSVVLGSKKSPQLFLKQQFGVMRL